MPVGAASTSSKVLPRKVTAPLARFRGSRAGGASAPTSFHRYSPLTGEPS
jgi:hypothetical protein